MRTWRLWRIVAVVLAGTLLLWPGDPQNRSRGLVRPNLWVARPNVVLILLDDLGYGDLGCFGARDVRTPHIDRLAREGVRLTDGYAAGPVCTPTRAALMTGRYPQRAGLEWAIAPGDRRPGLPASEISVARMLKECGYATALFGKWHLGYDPAFGPQAHGFDEFFGFLSADIDYYSHKEITGDPDLYEGTGPVERTGYMTDLITARASAYIGRHAAGPFFLYVAYNAVHWPFQPPDRPADVRDAATWYQGTRQDYIQMLECVDVGVGKILAALDRHGLADRTLVVLTTDNGGEWLSRVGPLFGRKGTLWEGGIRVPCLVRWPGRLPAGTTSADPTITMDLTATILAVAGARAPRGRALDGHDLLPVLRRERPPRTRPLCWRIVRPDRPQWAVRKGRWKYLWDGGFELLFDLDTDPGERRDLGARHPEVVADLRAELDRWEADLARSRPAFRLR
jgi:arylsulfatase A-like enzyme